MKDKIEIPVRINGNNKWIPIEEFANLFQIKEISTKGMPLSYPKRVEQFFSKLHTQEEVIQIWREAYPNVGLDTELKKIKAWLLTNTRTPKKDFKRFINNWLSKASENKSKYNYNQGEISEDEAEARSRKKEKEMKANLEHYDSIKATPEEIKEILGK